MRRRVSKRKQRAASLDDASATKKTKRDDDDDDDLVATQAEVKRKLEQHRRRGIQLALSHQLIRDEWQPQGQVGQGGFGTVFLATRLAQKPNKKSVAVLKVINTLEVVKQNGWPEQCPLPPVPRLDRKGNANLPDEAAVLWACERARVPHIVKLEMVFLFAGFHTCVLVFEWAPRTLFEVLAHGDVDAGPLLQLKAHRRKIVRQLCDALGALHRAGFVHRDVKPENMLLTPEFDLRLADFGAATERERALFDPLQVTTMPYRAPEMLYAAWPLTERLDVWAVGCVLWELVQLDPRQGMLFPTADRDDLHHRLVQWTRDAESPWATRLAQLKAKCPRHTPSEYLELLLRLLEPNAHDRVSLAYCAQVLSPSASGEW